MLMLMRTNSSALFEQVMLPDGIIAPNSLLKLFAVRLLKGSASLSSNRIEQQFCIQRFLNVSYYNNIPRETRDGNPQIRGPGSSRAMDTI